MADHEIEDASTTEGLPVAPSLGPGLAARQVRKHVSGVEGRVAALSAAAIAPESSSLREAADLVLHEKIGRLPVLRPGAPPQLVGILSANARP